MGNYNHFLDVQKSSERQASKKFYNKCSENSRSQIVLRTDIFRKFLLGAPERRSSLLKLSSETDQLKRRDVAFRQYFTAQTDTTAN